MSGHEERLREAVRLAQENRAGGGRPFGAVLVVNGTVVATGVNEVVASHDPTAHAEMEALRAACRKLGQPELPGAVVYASGHPCPMCLAALVAARVGELYFAFDNEDAAPFGFSSERTYRALGISLEALPMTRTRLDVGVTAAELYG